MKAPSERHLEDYLCDHPGIFPQVDPRINPAPAFNLICRQPVFPTGRPDLIGTWYGAQLAIVELKKGSITPLAFAQLMRYMRDIQGLLYDALYVHFHSDAPFKKLDCSLEQTFIRGVLVGHAIEPSLLMACEACNVDVFFYDFDGKHYTLEYVSPERDENPRMIVSLANQEITSVLVRLMRDQAQRFHEAGVRRDNNRFRAVRAANDHLGRLRFIGEEYE